MEKRKFNPHRSGVSEKYFSAYICFLYNIKRVVLLLLLLWTCCIPGVQLSMLPQIYLDDGWIELVFFEWKLSPGPSASIALYCGPGLQDRGTSLPHNFSTNSRLVIFEAVCYTTGIVMTTLTVQDSVSARRHAHFVKCFWLFYCFCCCLLLLS